MTLKTSQSSSKTSDLPSSMGFKMPAEWARHEATWLAWPHNSETWPGSRLAKVQESYIQMLAALLPHETVHLLLNDERERDAVVSLLKKRGVDLKKFLPQIVPTADSWIRDYGPTFVVNEKGGKAWCRWIFNAWGGKYAELIKDAKVFSSRPHPSPLPQTGEGRIIIPYSCFDSGIVLEGGSIEVNGEGACLTTEQCLLNPNRNPKLSRTEIEIYLKNYLGVSHIVWLKEGIIGDDTDGHIDDIARFVNTTTILAAYEEDESDENYPALKENWTRLQNDRKWDLVKLPMPGKVEDDGERLPASYANFYIANKVVLLPVYDHPNDKRAIKILQELFPGREVHPISCRAMVYGLGAIHCVTQQEPA